VTAFRAAWLDCASGISGDMLLGALADAGVPLETMQAAVDAVAPSPVVLRASETTRGGLRAMKVDVEAPSERTHRTWREIRTMLDGAALEPGVRDVAMRTFTLLAGAEARVHGTTPDDVHFHEVGGLDAIADVVGCAAGLGALGLSDVTAGPVAVGAGTVQTQHGRLPVPAPAVVELLRDAPTYGGGVAAELTTPTGAALLAAVVTEWRDQPPMRVERQAFGAGTRELADRPNAVRLLIGEPTDGASAHEQRVLEANVDDMDPRLWPHVLATLLDAGAADAWLVPIMMKKGRPAHTLCVLVDASLAGQMRNVLFAETTTIGVRESRVTKHALARHEHTVVVDGHDVRVKVATRDGVPLNAQPEYDDVAAAAAATGRPIKDVLAAAIAAARELGPRVGEE
jgi:hypothetical protein